MSEMDELKLKVRLLQGSYDSVYAALVSANGQVVEYSEKLDEAKAEIEWLRTAMRGIRKSCAIAGDSATETAINNALKPTSKGGEVDDE